MGDASVQTLNQSVAGPPAGLAGGTHTDLPWSPPHLTLIYT